MWLNGTSSDGHLGLCGKVEYEVPVSVLYNTDCQAQFLSEILN